MLARTLKIVSVALLILGMSSVPAIGFQAGSFQLIPGVRSWLGLETSYLWLSGGFLVPAGGRPGSGTLVSASGQLGVNQTEAASVYLRSLILSSHLIDLDYWFFAPTGVRQVAEEFRFQNKTYEEGTLVEASLEFNWIRGAYGYRLWKVKGWNLSPRIGVHHVRHRITINAESEEAGLLSNTRKLDGTYPVLGMEARYLFPFGFDLRAELEGIHLITRGFLVHGRIGASWQMHPDVTASVDVFNRTVRFIETNQELNNQWLYIVSGISTSIAFSF